MDYKPILIISLFFAVLATSCPQIRQNTKLCQCHGHSFNCHVATSSSNCQNGSSNGLVHCLDCQNGTTGNQCQSCKNGYYRPVTEDLKSACTKCQCHSYGSFNPQQCNQTTGQCVCREGFTGLACNKCAAGYYKSSTSEHSCIKCKCHSYGSINQKCDQTTGQCVCREEFTGLACNECAAGYLKTSASVQPCIKIQYATPKNQVKRFNMSTLKNYTGHIDLQANLSKPKPMNCRHCDFSSKHYSKRLYCRADTVIKGKVLSITNGKGWIDFKIASSIVYKENEHKLMSENPIHNFRLMKQNLRCKCFRLKVGRYYMIMLNNKYTNVNKPIEIDGNMSIKPWTSEIDLTVLFLDVDTRINGCTN